MLRITEIAQSTPKNSDLFMVPSQPDRGVDAWKKLIGNRPVSARLDPLPQAKPRWSALLAGTFFQTVLTTFLIFVPVLFPGNLVNRNAFQAVFVAPQSEITLPETERLPHAKVVSPSPAVLQSVDSQPPAQLIAPRLLAPAARKPVRVDNDDVPTLSETSAKLNLQASLSQPDRPRQPVKVGALSPANEAPLESSKPTAQIRAGGFGQPNGLPANSSDPRGNVARAGFSSVSTGPGFGNGSGGVSGARGAVGRAGFGDDAEISGVPRRSGGVVQSGGFEAAAVASPATKVKAAEASPAVQPVVILAKPSPVYSNEARKLGLEGEVLVDVIFLASGEVRVLRVTHGLGHGLDEAAVRAAQQIRFKPALQEAKSVDFPATVHIQFELAF